MVASDAVLGKVMWDFKLGVAIATRGLQKLGKKFRYIRLQLCKTVYYFFLFPKGRTKQQLNIQK